MKKSIFVVLLICLFSCIPFGMYGCAKNRDEVIRIHIRANSNEECDQDIKLKVRDCVVQYITPLIASCTSSIEVKNALSTNIKAIERVCDNALLSENYNYQSRAKISNEYFPTREYEERVFPADYYDALIIELGSGKGDNWWCVAYPPLCFVGEDSGSGEVRYRSKILEMIENFFAR